VSDAICVFVNEHPVEVGPGSTVLRAVRLFDPALGEQVTRGEAIVPVAPGSGIGSGDADA
jgi:hypothetical protein